MANKVAELIFIPAPALGHIMSTIELAKLLVNRDERLAVTVLVIKPFSLISSPEITAYIDYLAKNTMDDPVSFIQLPQDETPSKDPLEYIKSHCKYVRNVVADLKSQLGSGCRVAGFVVDTWCTCMIDVANEFNVPSYAFITGHAAFLGFALYVKTLCDDPNKNVIQLFNLETEVSIPSFVKQVPTKVFWHPVKTKEGLDFFLPLVSKLREVKAIMVNTFMDLEPHVIESMPTDICIPPVFPVGPILNLEGCPGAGEPLEDDTITWLNNQPPSSVVFLCFGSLGSFDEAQLKEIARGLEQSGHRFLWSLRQPPLDQTSRDPREYEDLSEILPQGFMERTRGIGKVIGWAPQVEVLAHDAVGGFVSHCGWNSLLESLWFGVPVAAWPMYAEQHMNAFEMVVELGLAVEITLDYKKDMLNPEANTIITVTAEDIENGIRRVMEEELRRKVKDMSAKSRSAMVEGGSSYASVGFLIQDFIRD